MRMSSRAAVVVPVSAVGASNASGLAGAATGAGNAPGRSTMRAWLRTPDPAPAVLLATSLASAWAGVRASAAGASAALAAERVAAIVAAAEETAERMRLETEERVNARIAEAQRAADNRVRAAEEEASDAVRLAQTEAARLRSSGEADAEAARTAATNEALGIVARAEESASQIVSEARSSADASLASAEERARGMLEDARATAEGVRSEGLELVSNLREMSNSLRANAERLLGTSSAFIRRSRPRSRGPSGARESGLRRLRRLRRRAVVVVSCRSMPMPSAGTTCSTCRSSSRRAEPPAERFSCTRRFSVRTTCEHTFVMNSNVKGAVAEQAIVLAATKLGVPVLRPVADHGRTDLALEIGGDLFRVQVKWGRLSPARDVVIVALATSRCTPRGHIRSTYAEHEVDLFAVYCGKLDRCFLLPAGLLVNKTVVYLRLTAARNGQRACINLADDFTFDGAVAQLARATRWQRVGQGFESPQLHSFSDSRSESVTIGAEAFRESRILA